MSKGVEYRTEPGCPAKATSLQCYVFENSLSEQVCPLLIFHDVIIQPSPGVLHVDPYLL